MIETMSSRLIFILLHYTTFDVVCQVLLSGVRESKLLNTVMPICNNCQVEFPTKSGSYNKFCSLKCANIDLAYKSREKSKEKYYTNPMLCHFCGGVVSYEASRWKRRDLNRARRENRVINIFCSRSCAGSYNGTIHPKRKKNLLKKESIKKIMTRKNVLFVKHHLFQKQ